MNFLHIIIIITVLILIKVIFLTNKKLKDIVKQVLVLLCISVFIIISILGVKKPLLSVLSIDVNQGVKMISLLHLEEGILSDVIGSEIETEVLSLLEACEVGYSLRYYNERYEESFVMMSVLILGENHHKSFSITADGLILSEGKYYRILGTDMLKELEDIVSSNTNTRKW